jgi:Bacterial-like globin
MRHLCSVLGVGLLGFMVSFGAAACGDDDDDMMGTMKGSGGTGGTAGAGGSGGGSGTGGTAGTGNPGGAGGAGGASGQGGAGGAAGGSGKTPTFNGPGPGATLVCKSTDPNDTGKGKNAYETYGAAGFVAATNEIIKGAMAADTNKLGTTLDDFYNDPDAPPDQAIQFTESLRSFLVWAYGGPNEYYGRTMQVSHTGLNITRDQYDYFVSDVIVPALTEVGVKAEDLGSCFAPIVTDESFILTIIDR